MYMYILAFYKTVVEIHVEHTVSLATCTCTLHVCYQNPTQLQYMYIPYMEVWFSTESF